MSSSSEVSSMSISARSHLSRSVIWVLTHRLRLGCSCFPVAHVQERVGCHILIHVRSWRISLAFELGFACAFAPFTSAVSASVTRLPAVVANSVEFFSQQATRQFSAARRFGGTSLNVTDLSMVALSCGLRACVRAWTADFSNNVFWAAAFTEPVAGHGGVAEKKLHERRVS